MARLRFLNAHRWIAVLVIAALLLAAPGEMALRAAAGPVRNGGGVSGPQNLGVRLPPLGIEAAPLQAQAVPAAAASVIGHAASVASGLQAAALTKALGGNEGGQRDHGVTLRSFFDGSAAACDMVVRPDGSKPNDAKWSEATARRLLPGPAVARAVSPSSLREAYDRLESGGSGPASARLLTDNVASWVDTWRMLEGAKSNIDTMYFSLERDPIGFAFLGFILKKMRGEGVRARVMTDAMADTYGQRGFKTHWGGKDYLQELAAHGAEVGIYHPIWQRPFRFLSLGFLASNHDKILTIDGKVGKTGGRNVGREYFADHRDMPHAWRDTDITLEGAGPVKGLWHAFDLEFRRTGIVSRVRPDRLGNWRKRDLELIGAYLLMDLWLKDAPMSPADKAGLAKNEALRQGTVDGLVARAIGRLPQEGIARAPNRREIAKLREIGRELVDNAEMRGAYHASPPSPVAVDAKILDQTAVIGGRRGAFAQGLAALAEHAARRIVIENPYVVLTEEMIKSLEAASKRGVEIIIGTNSPLSTDSAVTQAFFLEDWPYILARVPTARIFVSTGRRKLHAKTATIDDVATIVSTYNLDFLSGHVNSEVGAVVWSKEIAERMNAAFLADYADPSNGVVEYKIKRDAAGRALLVGGKPVVEFGPEDHLSKEILDDYAFRRKLWKAARRLPYFRALRHPRLRPSS